MKRKFKEDLLKSSERAKTAQITLTQKLEQARTAERGSKTQVEQLMQEMAVSHEREIERLRVEMASKVNAEDHYSAVIVQQQALNEKNGVLQEMAQGLEASQQRNTRRLVQSKFMAVSIKV